MNRLYSTPKDITLGALDLIKDGKARNFVLEIGDGRFHGFVVRKGRNVFGYVDVCPHAGLPLAEELDDYLSSRGDMILCSWHGALFRIKDGYCVGGPCAGDRLTKWPVKVKGADIVTA
ncbi:MAG: Rieske (2Fe-2S) protein [Asticcacaulis sp.]|nr:Rieske (2Fe-2S) protein [Asticcacaulis sp.]